MNQIITIHTRFQQRRGTAARWAAVNPILQEGEIGLELDTRRIKFGDGVTAWNDLEYSTQELFPASATQLGGIIAADKGKNYTVEVQIDPKTHRLYIPAYPTMPELAAVATSGDYNDLDNTPAPYELPAATETVIGGVAAAQITTGYTVEVKKDPASHKLYVPAASGGGSVEDDGKLPGLVIRVIYKQQASLSLGALGSWKIAGLSLFDSLDFLTANIQYSATVGDFRQNVSLSICSNAFSSLSYNSSGVLA